MCNRAWIWSCRGEARRFDAALSRVHSTQHKLLNDILAANATCELGRRYGFARICDIDDFRARVPLSGTRDLESHVDRIASGHAGVLTSEPVLMLEPTSGSTGPSRLLPYTNSLRSQFQRAIRAWVWSAARNYPSAFAGRSYWSISPPGQRPTLSSGGIPIGFDDDAAYLGRHERWLLDKLLARPPRSALLSQAGRSLDNFRFATLLCLVATGDLSLVSAWSPTFILGLVEAWDQWHRLICRSLSSGRVTLPGPADLELTEDLQHQVGRRSRRGAECDRLFDQPFERIWPKLGLISCWADGASGRFLPTLQRHFPNTPIQPKGLLATEGVVTIPWPGAAAGVLAIRSHVYEFLPVSNTHTGATDSTRLPGELVTGEQYEVVLTTGGGLYRYRLGDMVEVIGWERDTPCLRFVGRRGAVSDIVGEKLNEHHVQSVVDAAIADAGLDADLALLTPIRSERPGYELFLQAAPGTDRKQLRSLCRLVELGLCDNPHYDLARRLGQLQPLRVSGLRGHEGWRRYEQAAIRRGSRLGNIKPGSLDTWDGWEDVLGDLVEYRVVCESC